MWPLSSTRPYLVSDGESLAGFCPLLQSVGEHKLAWFLYHCLSFYIGRGRCFWGLHLDSWAPFYHSNHTRDLLLGKICHSQGLEIGLTDLGLSVVLLNSDSWDGGHHCFISQTSMPSSCFGFIFLPVPWPSEIPPGPSTHAFYDKRTTKVGGAHLNFPSLEVLSEKSDRDQYELLCPDNTRKPVDQFEECYLARVPSHAVVARAVDGKEDLIWEILKVAQVPCPPATILSPSYNSVVRSS